MRLRPVCELACEVLLAYLLAPLFPGPRKHMRMLAECARSRACAAGMHTEREREREREREEKERHACTHYVIT